MPPPSRHRDSRTHDVDLAVRVVLVIVALLFAFTTGLVSTPGWDEPLHFSAAALVYAIFALAILATLLEGVRVVKRYRRETAAKQRQQK